MAKETTIAHLTLTDAAKWSPREARLVAHWLRRQADHVTKSADRAELSNRYTARYLRLSS